MQPLDFSVVRPRGPRVKLAGLVFTARVVDKLRAAQPGGNLNAFLPFTGFSQVWQKYSGIDLHELYDVVAACETEDDVVAWIEDRTREVDRDAFNAKLEGFVTARLPDAWRPAFEAFYPPQLRERYDTIIDLLEADDDRLYGVRPASNADSSSA